MGSGSGSALEACSRRCTIQIYVYSTVIVTRGRMQAEEFGALTCRSRSRLLCQNVCCRITPAPSPAAALHQALTWLPLLELIVCHVDFLLNVKCVC